MRKKNVQIWTGQLRSVANCHVLFVSKSPKTKEVQVVFMFYVSSLPPFFRGKTTGKASEGENNSSWPPAGHTTFAGTQEAKSLKARDCRMRPADEQEGLVFKHLHSSCARQQI